MVLKFIYYAALAGGFASFLFGVYLILFFVLSSFNGRDKRERIGLR